LAPEGTVYPVLAVEGMFLLPGVPSLFKLQLETVLSSLPKGAVHVRSLYLSRGEAEIAAALDRVALGMPDVGIGSYPAVTSGADHASPYVRGHRRPRVRACPLVSSTTTPARPGGARLHDPARSRQDLAG